MSEAVLNTMGPSSAGAFLKKIREAKGWTVQDICDQLRLHRTLIGQLEADEYTKLPPPAFVKGYLRSYSRLLEVDEKHVLELYLATEAEDPIISTIANVQAETSSSHPLIKITSLVLIVAVVSAIGLWWFGNQSYSLVDYHESTTTSDQLEEVPEKPPVTSEELPVITENSDTAVAVLDQVDVELGSMPESNELVSNLLSDPTDDSNLSESLFVEPFSILDTAAMKNNVISQQLDEVKKPRVLRVNADEIKVTISPPVPDSVPEKVTIETASLSNNQGNNQVVTDDVTTEPAAVSDDVLLLKTEQESWVSVIDSREQRLMYGMLTSGTPRKLTGVAPFQVVLGLAPDIELTLNGQSINFLRFVSKSKAARFVVGADGKSYK